MNILVLGAAGFIGKNLCTALIAAGHKVCGFDLPPAGNVWPDIPGLCWQVGTTANREWADSLFEGIDLIVHLVSTTVPKTSNENPLADLTQNVSSTLTLLDAITSRVHPPRLIFLSSGGTVYGIPRTIPLTEDHPTEPLCAYGIGKLAIEKYLALYGRLRGLDYQILRLANPFGKYQSHKSGQGVIASFLHRALHNVPLEVWGDGSVIRDYLYIDDTVSAIMSVMEYQGPERIFNIGSGFGHSLNDLIAGVRQLIGHEVIVAYTGTRTCDVPVNILDISRASAGLGWRPSVPLIEGMARTLQWLRYQK